MKWIVMFFLFSALGSGATNLVDTRFLALKPEKDGIGSPTLLKQGLLAHHAFVSGLDQPGWTAPGVWADPKNRRVLVWGQSTGMRPGEPVEFFVISTKSGYDYESVMTSFAAPSDVHKALEAIGCRAGVPVDSRQRSFWPTGDRLRPRIHLKALEGGELQERCLYDFVLTGESTPVPPMDWVFVGSRMLEDPTHPDELVYAADTFDPNSIASTFNLVNTVFDLPRQGGKTEVYGQMIYNPALDLPAGHPLLLELTPGNDAGISSSSLQIRATDQEAPRLRSGGQSFGTFDALALAWEAEDAAELHLEVDFGPDLSLDQIMKAAQHLLTLEHERKLVRIAPPPQGQLYYQAYLAPEAYRHDRQARPSQPWELHLHAKGPATLMKLEERWGTAIKPEVIERPVELPNPASWEAHVAREAKDMHVLFVYTPSQTPHRLLQEWIGPVLEQFPVIYVYAETE